MYMGTMTMAGPAAPAPTAADEMARLLATVASLMESGAVKTPEGVARLVPQSDFPQLAANTTLSFPQLVYGLAQATQQAMAVKRRDEKLAATTGSVGGPPLTTLQVEFRRLQQAMGQAITAGARTAEAVAARLQPDFGRAYTGLGAVISDVRGFLINVASSLGNPAALASLYSRWTGEPAVGGYPGSVGISLGDISAVANIATAFVPLFVKDQRANNIVAAARGALSTAAAAERGDVSAAIKAGTQTAQSIAQAAGADARVQAALAQAGEAGQALAEQKLAEDYQGSQRTVAVLRQNLEAARQRGDLNAQAQIGMQLYRAEAQSLLDGLQLRRARGEAISIPADLVQQAQQGPIRPWGGIYPIFVPPEGTPAAPAAPATCPPGYSRFSTAQIQAYTQAGTPVTVAETLPDGSVCARVQGVEAPACPPDMVRMTSAEIQAAVQAGTQLEVGETFADGTACVRTAVPTPAPPPAAPLPGAPPAPVPGYAPPAGLPAFQVPQVPAPAVPAPPPAAPGLPGARPIPAARPIPGPFAVPGVPAVPIEDEESVCDPEAAGRCARALSRFGTYESARRLSCCRLLPSGRGVVLAEFAEASENWPGRYTEVPAADYWYLPCAAAERLTPAASVVQLPGLEPVAPCVPILGSEFSTVIVPQGWLIRLYDQYGFRGEVISLTAGSHDLARRGWANRARSVQVRGPWTLRDGVIFDALRQREKGWATEDVAGGLKFSNVLQALRNDPARPVGAGRTKQMVSWVSSYGPGYGQRLAVARNAFDPGSRALIENFRLLNVY